MTTTNLLSFQPRIETLICATGGSVTVSVELVYRKHREPAVEWTVYLAAGAVNDGQHLYHDATLQGAVAAAEYACGLSPTTLDAVVLP